MKSFAYLTLAVLLMASATGHAEVLLNNLSNGVQSFGTTDHYVAQEFSTGNTLVNITGATLTFDLAGQGTTGSDYTVSIYTDTTSGFTSPSINLGTLTYNSSTPSNGFSAVTYTTSVPIDLDLNTVYWIVAAPVDATNNVAWMLSSSTSSSSAEGVAFINNSANSSDGTNWSVHSGIISNQNETLSVALSGNVIATPEPSVWVLLGFGLVALIYGQRFFPKNRRRF